MCSCLRHLENIKTHFCHNVIKTFRRKRKNFFLPAASRLFGLNFILRFLMNKGFLLALSIIVQSFSFILFDNPVQKILRMR